MSVAFNNKVDAALYAILNKNIKEDIDDTLLQKFLSHLKSPNGILEDILEKTHLMALLQENLSSVNWEAISQTFALQLVNILIIRLESVEDHREAVLQIAEHAVFVIRNVFSPFANPSVKVAAIELITSLYEKNGKIPWLAKSGLLDGVCQSLSDRSYFVQNVAQKFLTICLVDCCKKQCDQALCLQLREIILCPLLKKSSERSSCLLPRVLEIVASAMNENNMVREWAREERIHISLLRDLDCCTGGHSEKTCKVLASLLSNTGKDDEIKDIIDFLIMSQEPVLLIKFIYFCLKMQEEIGQDSLYLSILYSPLLEIVPEGLLLDGKCQRMLTEFLLDKVTYQKMLTTSLSCMCDLFPLFHLNVQKEIVPMIRASLAVNGNCRKTLTSLIQLYHKILHSQDLELENKEIMKSIEALQSMLTAPVVTSAIFNQLLQSILQLARLWSTRSTNVWEMETMSSLGKALNRKLVDRNWEIIDSVLEFLANILDLPSSEEWICQHKLHSAVWSVVYIPYCDGYVKASAIKALAEMCLRERTWKKLVSDENLSMASLFSILLQYVQDDTDVFVQRSAALAMMKLSDNRNHELYIALQWCCSCSLDWELKLTALHTWQKIAMQELCSQIPVEESVQHLYEVGFLSSLVTTLADCERTVCLLSAQIMFKFRNELIEKGFTIHADSVINVINTTLKQDKEVVTSNSALGTTSHASNEILEEILDLDMRKYLTGIIRSSDECDVPIPKTVPACEKSCEELLHCIWASDLLRLIQENTVSTDIYAGNFEALVDDILTAIEEPHTKDSQVIDCY